MKFRGKLPLCSAAKPPQGPVSVATVVTGAEEVPVAAVKEVINLKPDISDCLSTLVNPTVSILER